MALQTSRKRRSSCAAPGPGWRWCRPPPHPPFGHPLPDGGEGESLMFLEDCTRTEPAIFAIYMQSSKQLFDSPCNLRTSHAVHRAIFAPHAAGGGAIVWDGSSPALILMVLPVWLGRTLNALARSWEGEPHGEPWPNPARTEPRPPGITQSCLDRNGPGTAALNYKVRSSQGRGIGFRFVPRQKKSDSSAVCPTKSAPPQSFTHGSCAVFGNAGVAQNAPKSCHFVPLCLAKLLLHLA
jgi:hypothetical protein